MDIPKLKIVKEFTVDSILDKKVTPGAKIEYKGIQWKGNSNSNTLETAEHLKCSELLGTFEAEWGCLEGNRPPPPPETVEPEVVFIDCDEFESEPELVPTYCDGIRAEPELVLIDCDQFSHQNEFINENITHNGRSKQDRNTTCIICDKHFSCSQYLVRHMRIVHQNVRHYVCDFIDCAKRFGNMTSLRVHQRCHTGEKPYQCNICPSKFSTRSILKLHCMTHSTDKKFSCANCRRNFVSECSWRRHMRTVHANNENLDAKQFECFICKKYFCGMASLKMHLRIQHTNERPYLCQFCGKQFKTKGDCRRHLAIHTEKHFECNICHEKL